jgi:predicted nuclease of predicted toxin-antitoxin system
LDYAPEHDLILITEDEDFPATKNPRVLVWVTIGNCSNHTLIVLLEQIFAGIERILSQEKALVRIQKAPKP